MSLFKTALVGALLLFTGTAGAADWDFGVGVTYASGISDVADLYEENYEAENPGSEVDTVTIPIGVSFYSRYQGDSGMTFNIGAGPAFIIFGDVDHTEIPLSATVGYAFSASGNSTAYVRAGVVVHFVSGDYVEDSEAGSLVALGFENGRNSGVNWGIEVSVDDSEVEFENLTRGRNEKINSYDTQLTLFFLF